MWTSKYSGSMVIVAKIADIGPPGAPQYFFQKKTSNVRITVHLDLSGHRCISVKTRI